jgi:nitronate monooxygenase
MSAARHPSTPEFTTVAMALRTPVCDLLRCDIPLVLAGMGGVARSELVAAVTQAGGFGFLGMVRESPALIRQEVLAVRARTERHFGVNVIPAATKPALLDAQLDVCIDLRVPVVCLFWDLSKVIVRRLREAGVLVVCQVGSIGDACEAQEAGAQVLIVQGHEAGGHVRGTQPLARLLPDVLARASVPVLAAGGITDGADIATVMALGAQGVVLGTAMIATHESFAHDYHKQRIVETTHGQTVVTQAFHINWPPGAQVRVLANSVTRGEHGSHVDARKTVIGEEEGRPIHLFSTDSPLRSMTGIFEAMALYAGKGAARIDAIVGAQERLHQLAADAAASLRGRALRFPECVTLSSPVCFADELDAVDQAATQREAVLSSLNELLEAERAGARITLFSAAEATDPALKRLVTAIHRDEVRWCGVLIDAIQSLSGTSSTCTGAFYKTAMAVQDMNERMALLNRGQGWVVKKLQALLPRIDNVHARHALSEMLTSHEKNIERVNVQLAPAALPRARART